MLQRPRFKPHFQVEVVPGYGVFLLSEMFHRILQGSLYERVALELNGQTVEAICDRLAGKASAAQVFYTLKRLEQGGYLCEGEVAGDGREDEFPASPAIRPDEAALWSMQGLDPPAVGRRLAAARVDLQAFGIDREAFGESLRAMHLTAADGGDFAVVVADHYLRPELRAFNAQSLRSGRPWLLMKPAGAVVWLGPLFRPGKTACWECLAQRILANQPVLGFFNTLPAARQWPRIDCAATPATQAAAFALAAQAVATWIAREGVLTGLEGKIRSVDLVMWGAESHLLVRQPSCPACGAAPARSNGDAHPVRLQPCKKTYVEGSGHRALSPQETLDRFGHHVSPICGAVTMLQRTSPTQDHVMHVYVSGHNVARGPMSLMDLKVDLRSSSCGKGTNDVQAKASALCEGLERYCGIFRGDEPRKTARMEDLGAEAIDPNACMLFSRRQYERRLAPELCDSVYTYVPNPFDPRRPVEWTPVWSLSRDEPRYLPTAFCYFGYPQGEADYCVGCSNGNAAGNTLEEAVLQGFFELVERDSVSLWWYNRATVRGLDLASFQEPYLDRLKKFWDQQKRRIWALDLTTDLGIPVFAAVAQRVSGASEQIMLGFGAHLDAKIALLRAVTELNQMMVPLLRCGTDGEPLHLNDKLTLDWLRTGRLADHAYLAPAAPLQEAPAYPRCWTDDLRDDILLCKQRVERLGLEMFVLDQTRPEIEMPVVKVIVPGLRHFWARFAPGRLYDVPVRLGWLPRPLSEEALNPIPMFL